MLFKPLLPVPRILETWSPKIKVIKETQVTKEQRCRDRGNQMFRERKCWDLFPPKALFWIQSHLLLNTDSLLWVAFVRKPCYCRKYVASYHCDVDAFFFSPWILFTVLLHLLWAVCCWPLKESQLLGSPMGTSQ